MSVGLLTDRPGRAFGDGDLAVLNRRINVPHQVNLD
jgi:hypothetical protein